MRHFQSSLLIIASLFIAPFARAQADAGSPGLTEILALWTPYQDTLKTVAADRDKKVENLDRIYLLNLDKVQKETTAAGDLEGALAVKAERDRIAAHQETTEEQRKAMGPALAKLRMSYDAALKGYVEEAVKRDGVLLQKYLADLETLQKSITTTGDLEKALLVKAEKERVKAGENLVSHQPPAKVSSTKDAWIDLFNGRDLSGWAGIPQYWSVKGGAVVGKSTKDTPNTGNTFLVWQGGQVSDFEFSCKYKLESNNPDGQANSGIQFRAFMTESARFAISGYQAELDPGTLHPKMWPRMANMNGCLLSDGKDERPGGGFFAAVGQKVVVRPVSAGPASVTVTGSLGKDQDFAAMYKPRDWNEVRILVVGNHIQIFVNGRQTVDAVDESNRYSSGLLGLQLQGPQLFKTIHFKDLKLRQIQ